MSNTIKHIRSSVTGRVPTTSQLELGELGINTTDGKLFLKKSVSGTETIVDIGGGTQLSDEEVQDIVGGMVQNNTESGITVTYQDVDGTIDFAVASQTDNNFTTTLKNKLDGIEGGAEVNTVNSVNGNTGDVDTVLNTFGSSAPTSPNEGDFWTDTSTTPPTLKSYNGTAWVSVGSAGTGSGIENTFSASAPTSPNEGDFWVDTSTNPPALKSYNGTAWISITTSPSAPVINSVTLAESDATGDRFTSESFTVTVSMVDDGTPVSQKKIKGTVTASFDTFPSTNAITAITTNTTATNEGTVSYGSVTALGTSSPGATSFPWIDNGVLKMFMLYRHTSTDTRLLRHSSDLLSLTNVDSNVGGTDHSFLFQQQNRAGTHVNLFRHSDSYSITTESMGGTNVTMAGTVHVSTDLYEYEITASTSRVVRTVKATGVTSSSCELGNSDDYLYAIETASDRVVFIAEGSTSSTLYYQEYTDVHSASDDSRWAGGNKIWTNSSSTTSITRSQLRNYLWHKDQLFLTGDTTAILVFSKGNSTPAILTPPTLPAPPSGETWSTSYAQCLWEEPGGLLINRVMIDASKKNYIYYSSSNSGGTWVVNYYDQVETTGSKSRNGPYYTPDRYMHGFRLRVQTAGVSSSVKPVKQEVFLLGYQDVTVADGADLDDLNVGDLVKVDGVSDPNYYNYIMSITDNGNGSTTLRLRGFTTMANGDVLQAVASTGTSSSARFLVIDTQGAISTHQAVDPGYVTLGPGLSHTLTFPATFPTGNTPDEELPSGTSIQVDIRASNDAANDNFTSNSVTPS